MTAGIKANSDGSAAIQVGGSDYIEISAAGAVSIPQSLTIAGQPAGGNYALNAYTSPATWTKPAGLKAVKVTVVGAGGNGATGTSVNPNPGTGGGGGGGGAAIDYIPAPSIPGPIAVTAGPGTNSFGALCSATAGANGVAGSGTAGAGGAGGTGSGGSVNFTGQAGGTYGAVTGVGAGPRTGGNGVFGLGFAGSSAGITGSAAIGYGSGGSGGFSPYPSPAQPGGAGAPGIVIIEEFY